MKVLGHDAIPLLKRTWSGIGEDHISVYASQMAYAFFFALFPLLLFFAALLNLVADKQTVMGWVGGRITSALPGGVADMLSETARKIIFAKGAPGILSFGLLAAAWSGSSIFGAFRQALNAAYEVEETRPWWKQYALQLGSLVVAGVVLLSATVILLNGDGIMSWVGSHAGLGRATTLIWTIVQFPLAIAAVVVLLWLLYLYLPNCKHQNRTYVLAGAAVATVLWIAATLLFRLYVQKFHALNPAYGAIGAIMVLLTWMYYSSFVLLAAGELNSELQRANTTATTASASPTLDDEPHYGSRKVALVALDEAREGARLTRSATGVTAHDYDGGNGSNSGNGSNGRRGIASLLRSLASDAGTLVREQLALLRVETATIARDVGVGVTLIGTAVTLAFLGALSLVTGIILLIGDQWVPADLYWLAALAVTVIAAIAAAVVLARSRRALAPDALAPRETIDTLKEDVEWTREQLTSSDR